MTARSTGSGMSAIDAYARTPATAAAFGLTGYAAPSKPESRMLRKSSPPIEPRRVEAPTTATVAGAKNGAQRRGDGDVVALVDALAVRVRRGDLRAAPRSCRRRAAARPRSPRRRRPAASARSRAAPRRRSVEIPARRAAAASCSSSRVPDALALQRVGDGERHLGAARVAQPHVAGERDDLVVARVPTSDPRSFQSGSRNGSTVAGLSDGKPWKRRYTLCWESPPRKASTASASASSGGRSRSVPPVRRMTSRNSGAGDGHARQCRRSSVAGAIGRDTTAAP